MPVLKKKRFRSLSIVFVVAFVAMNVVAFFHAYKFTHFSNSATTKTKTPEKLSVTDKLQTLVLGVNNPKPTNKRKPERQYETLSMQSNKRIACWHIPIDSSNTALGTVILFHGYSSEKSAMLDKADELRQLGYNTLLVDFMGSGASEGNQTTLGYKEAEEVKTAFDYMTQQGEKNIYLLGSSMGAVAILKAIKDLQLHPKGIIVECPFGSMYQTVCARFKIMGIPCFPMASLLVFWGGIQNGFWAFEHNPTEYAKGVKCNTLLMYGQQDRNVSRSETDAIYKNLAGNKQLKIFPLTGHDDFLQKNRAEWIAYVSSFLKEN